MEMKRPGVNLIGYPFPSDSQELLLKAALFHGEIAIQAFYQWKRSVDFETEMQSSVYRTLPLLYHNLHQQDVDDDLMPRLKGIYRKSWMTNQFLFAKAGSILRFFNQNGIPVMVMKGIPLTILYYRNFGVRPMADIDVLIPYDQARSTVDLLRSEGWKLHEPEFLEHSLRYGRSATFSDSEKTELDLHWHPFFEAHESNAADDFNTLSVSLAVGGVATRTFCLTDHLFHTIVHGVRYNPEPPVRWIADACTLLKRESENISWDRLLAHTLRFRVHLQMKAALHYLADRFYQKIPDQVLRELDNRTADFAARVVFLHALTTGDRNPVTLREKMYSIYAGFLRQTSVQGFIRQHLAFMKYFRYRTKGKPWFKIFIYYFSRTLSKRDLSRA
jgi:hypothetical protein